MKRPIRSICFASLLTACGSTAQDTAQDLKMINGTQAKASEYASALVYKMPDGSVCSGVKVGKRLILTAAHCVLETYGMKTKDVLTAPQAKLEISNFPKRDSKDTSLWHSGYISRVVTPDTYADFLSVCFSETTSPEVQKACSGDWRAPEDLAVVEFKKDLPEQWATAVLDLKPVAAGETVTFVGYGCETTIDSTTTVVRKKYGAVKVLSWSQVSLDMNFGLASINGKDIEKTGYLTPGTAYPGMADKKIPGMCPGDSGGPVYRKDGVVVGVNKWFEFGSTKKTIFQTHARLNEEFLRANLPAAAFK